MSSAAGAASTAPVVAGASASAAPYWCYRCGRFVRVRAGEAVVCRRCETGFVELLGAPPIRSRRRDPISATYTVGGPAVASTSSRSHHQPDAGPRRRSRRGATAHRSPVNPVVVLRGPSEGRDGDGDVERPAGTFELYYDGGAGSGLRPTPAIMSDLLMGSAFPRLLEQLAHIEADAAGGRDPTHPPASKAAVEAMPMIRVAERHVRLDAHCAVCKEPFELGTEAREMPCRHIFHQDCILPWLSQRNSCPVCRHEMPTEEGSGRRAADSHGTEEAAARDRGEEDVLGLTIWRLPGGGFAVGRFPGGRRAGGRELPVVYTEVDGGLGTSAAPRRISWSSRSGRRSIESGGVGRAFRSFFSCFGHLCGSSSSSSSRLESGSSTVNDQAGSGFVRSSRRSRHS